MNVNLLVLPAFGTLAPPPVLVTITYSGEQTPHNANENVAC